MSQLNFIKKNKSFFVAILIFMAIGSAFLVFSNKAKAECTYLGEGGWDCPPGENPPTAGSQKSTSPATSQPSSQTQPNVSTQSQGATDAQLVDACKGKTRGNICTPQGSNYQGVCQPDSKGVVYCYTEENAVVNEAGQTQKSVDEAESEPGFIAGIAFYVIIKILGGIIYAIHTVFSWLLWLAAQLFDWVLTKPEFQQFTKAPIVQTGWALTRDLANMFFALILLIISFATILRIESYGVKQILPKLLIAALLINFSLVIAGVIIDFSQVLTKYFVDEMKGSSGSISATMMNGLDITATFKPGKMPTFAASMKGLLNLIISLWGGIILILVAAFTFFAGAILLIVRFIALWFLLILAPLAWLFYILPATRSYWNMWWSSFFKYVFFAPAFTFFLYLSIKITSSGIITKQAGFSDQQMANLSNQSFGAASIPLIINFIILIGFTVGALIVAQKMGIWGAGAVIGMGKSAGKTVGKFAARKGTGYDRWAPAATGAAGAVLSRIPGLRKSGGMLQGKAIQMREKQLERPGNKAYARYLNSLAPKELEGELMSARGTNALMAARAARDSKVLDNADPAVAQRAMAAFRAFGQIKEAREMEEIRPDAIVNPTEKDAAVQRAIASGAYKRWGAQVFQGAGGQEIMQASMNALPPGEFVNAYRGWSKQVQGQARTAMEGTFSDNFTDHQSNERRKLYASATNNITAAFTSSTMGFSARFASEHIQRMAPVHIGAVSDEKELRLIGEHITEGQLASIRGELNAYQKQQLKEGAKKGNAAATNYMQGSPAWNV